MKLCSYIVFLETFTHSQFQRYNYVANIFTTKIPQIYSKLFDNVIQKPDYHLACPKINST